MKFSLPIIIGIVCIIYAVYQFVNIQKSVAVTGHLCGYEDSSHTDSDGNFVDSKNAIYQIYYNGRYIQYRSIVNSLPFVDDETKTLYVNENGKVFEKQGAICFLAAGVVAIVIGVLL